MISTQHQLILASGSPRRKELLNELGFHFRIVIPDITEDRKYKESPKSTVERLSLAKAVMVSQDIGTGIIIGADSLVILDGHAIGKPSSFHEAYKTLKMLRHREHHVATGISVIDMSSRKALTVNVISEVSMRYYSDLQIDAYVASGLPMDKAGAYGIQDDLFHPVNHVEGCYTNVMGLPLCILTDILKGLGISGMERHHIPSVYGCYKCPAETSFKVSKI